MLVESSESRSIHPNQNGRSWHCYPIVVESSPLRVRNRDSARVQVLRHNRCHGQPCRQPDLGVIVKNRPPFHNEVRQQRLDIFLNGAHPPVIAGLANVSDLSRVEVALRPRIPNVRRIAMSNRMRRFLEPKLPRNPFANQMLLRHPCPTAENTVSDRFAHLQVVNPTRCERVLLP